MFTPRRTTIVCVALGLSVAFIARGMAGGLSKVDLKWSPTTSEVEVGEVFSIEYIAASDSPTIMFVGAIEAIIVFDPKKLRLVGDDVSNIPYLWLTCSDSTGPIICSGFGFSLDPLEELNPDCSVEVNPCLASGGCCDETLDICWPECACCAEDSCSNDLEQDECEELEDGVWHGGISCATAICNIFCGDTICTPGENCLSCPTDCGCAPDMECNLGVCELFCGNGTCDLGEDGENCPSDCPPCGDENDCDDGNDCTVDTCNPKSACEHTPLDELCDNDVFCDGAETCSVALGGCQPGVGPCINSDVCDEDGDVCVAQECDEGFVCDDGEYCNGLEVCIGGTWEDGDSLYVVLAQFVEGPAEVPQSGLLVTNIVFEALAPTTGTIVQFWPQIGLQRTKVTDGINPGLDITGELFSTNVVINAPVCGDGTCSGGEDCSNCAADCNCVGIGQCVDGECVSVCNDGECTLDENCENCLGDCPCGAGEQCKGGVCLAVCGDAVCASVEDCANCIEDCPCGPLEDCFAGVCATFCGNGVCEDDEDFESCPADCVECKSDEDCDDGIPCTIDDCSEQLTCGHFTNDTFCNDFDFCNGLETCELGQGCVDGPVPCGGLCCDEDLDECCPVGACCALDTCSDGVEQVECDALPDSEWHEGEVCSSGVCGQECGDTFCTGDETCDIASCPADCACGPLEQCDAGVCQLFCGNGQCDPGEDGDNCPDDCPTCTGPGDCDDGVGCTIDTCDENMCVHTPDASCDNGLFCDGVETCDAIKDCQPGTDPCDPGDTCDEGADTCLPSECGNNADCDDTVFCNGAELCIGTTCFSGTPPTCDDGIACTVDSCNVTLDACQHIPDQGSCNDGLFCNGVEICNINIGCISGADPCPGKECDEGNDECIVLDNGACCFFGGNSCVDDVSQTTCDEIDGVFIGDTVCAAVDCLDFLCGDNICSIEEDCTCVDCPCPGNLVCESGVCVVDCGNGLCEEGENNANCPEDCEACKTDEECDDGIACTTEFCSVLNETCVITPNHGFCQNNQFCDGAEECNLDVGCTSGPEPCPGMDCDETTDMCVPFIIGACCAHGGDVCQSPITLEECEDNLNGDFFLGAECSEGICDLVIVSSDPPDGSVDARQPTDPDGKIQFGVQAFTITFNRDILLITPVDFSVQEFGDDGVPPAILATQLLEFDTVILFLSEPLEPGTWTVFTYIPSDSSTQLGYLPGDVDGDCLSGSADVLTLVNHLNGVGEPLADYQADIDRSGAVNASDVLREIDLLNGAGAFDEWFGETLPGWPLCPPE